MYKEDPVQKEKQKYVFIMKRKEENEFWLGVCCVYMCKWMCLFICIQLFINKHAVYMYVRTVCVVCLYRHVVHSGMNILCVFAHKSNCSSINMYSMCLCTYTVSMCDTDILTMCWFEIKAKGIWPNTSTSLLNRLRWHFALLFPFLFLFLLLFLLF